jgi:hypothetical protein
MLLEKTTMATHVADGGYFLSDAISVGWLVLLIVGSADDNGALPATSMNDAAGAGTYENPCATVMMISLFPFVVLPSMMFPINAEDFSPSCALLSCSWRFSVFRLSLHSHFIS